MAKLINQYVDLKQHATNYLFQIDDLVRNFYKLKDKLTEVLFDIETKACHCHNLLDEGNIPLAPPKKLPSSYSEGFFFLEGIIIDFFKRKKILYEQNKIYSLALKEVEKVAHGSSSRDL
jgi:hypothetical protein